MIFRWKLLTEWGIAWRDFGVSASVRSESEAEVVLPGSTPQDQRPWDSPYSALTNAQDSAVPTHSRGNQNRLDG